MNITLDISYYLLGKFVKRIVQCQHFIVLHFEDQKNIRLSLFSLVNSDELQIKQKIYIKEIIPSFLQGYNNQALLITIRSC